MDYSMIESLKTHPNWWKNLKEQQMQLGRENDRYFKPKLWKDARDDQTILFPVNLESPDFLMRDVIKLDDGKKQDRFTARFSLQEGHKVATKLGTIDCMQLLKKVIYRKRPDAECIALGLKGAREEPDSLPVWGTASRMFTSHDKDFATLAGLEKIPHEQPNCFAFLLDATRKPQAKESSKDYLAQCPVKLPRLYHEGGFYVLEVSLQPYYNPRENRCGFKLNLETMYLVAFPGEASLSPSVRRYKAACKLTSGSLWSGTLGYHAEEDELYGNQEDDSLPEPLRFDRPGASSNNAVEIGDESETEDDDGENGYILLEQELPSKGKAKKTKRKGTDSGSRVTTEKRSRRHATHVSDDNAEE